MSKDIIFCFLTNFLYAPRNYSVHLRAIEKHVFPYMPLDEIDEICDPLCALPLVTLHYSLLQLRLKLSPLGWLFVLYLYVHRLFKFEYGYFESYWYKLVHIVSYILSKVWQRETSCHVAHFYNVFSYSTASIFLGHKLLS